MEDTDAPTAHWPAEIVRLVASLVVKDETPANRTLHLVLLCGVCKGWRQELTRTGPPSLPLAFDGAFDNAGATLAKATLAKFRRSDAAQKRATFLGASKLLTGFTDVTLSGECITDEILVNISRANGCNLVSLKLLGTPCVTDEGITALVSSTPKLKQFTLEDAGLGVVGNFVPAILQCCRQLETLHIEGAEGLNWAELRHSGAWWHTLATADADAAGSPSASGSSSAQAAAGSSSSRAAQQQQQHPMGDDPPASSSADGAMHRHHHHHHRRHRISSDASDSLLSEDDDSDDGSLGAASDSTSISVPAAGTAALAVQLQHSMLQDDGAGPSSSSSSRHSPMLLQQQEAFNSQQQQQHGQQQQPDMQEQGPEQQHWGIPCHTALRRLHVRFANVDSLQQLIERCPGLTDLQLDGPAFNIQSAAVSCPNIKRLAFLVGSPLELDAALFYLNSMGSLRGLELEVKGMMLSTEQLRVIGMLPLRELALDSHAYRQQPSMPRPQYSHLDNEGVKGLVDSICSRMRSEMMPLKLSLCGATALKQEAVSALLRLPMLTAIDTGGCIKLTPMDRMRLVAKVKAGQGMLDSKGTSPSGALASLRVPHGHLL